jgi:hypothetical protein
MHGHAVITGYFTDEIKNRNPQHRVRRFMRNCIAMRDFGKHLKTQDDQLKLVLENMTGRWNISSFVPFRQIFYI